jgi:PAS domain S-box-containing protein
MIPKDYMLRWGVSFKQLLAGFKEGVLILDTDGKILNTNRAEIKRSGFGLKYYRSKSIADLVDPSYKAIVKERLQLALQGKRSLPIRCASSGKNGNTSIVSIEFTRLSGKNGGLALGIIRDMTRQISADNKLQFYCKAVESSTDALVMADEAGRVTYANRSAGRMAGAPAGKLLGESITDSLLGEKALKHILDRLKEGKWSGDFSRFQADGKRFYYRLRLFLLKKAGGMPFGYLLGGRDVTFERRGWEKFYQLRRTCEGETAAQNAWLRICRESYEGLLDNAPIGVFVQSKKGLILVNKPFKGLTGHDPGSLRSHSFLDLVVSTHKKKVEEYFQEILKGRNPAVPFKETCRLINRGGSQIEVSLSLAPLVFMQEVAVIGTIMDISELKELHAQVVKSERLMTTGKLAAAISHEMSHPIQGILRSMKSLREDSLSGRQMDACKVIEVDLARIENMVRHIISMYQFEDQRKSFLSLNDVLTESLDLLANQINKNGVSVKLNLSPYIHKVVASPHQIFQLFTSIILYSLGSMPSGGRISVSSRKRGRNIIMIFEDTGIGISEEELKNLFDPSYASRDWGEWGLGLHSVYEIIRQHDGEIKVGSTLGKGSRFVITLPVSP